MKLLIRYLKKNEFESRLLRKIFEKKFNITVGLYSYGCFDPARIPPGSQIGRYCSLSTTCHIFSRNHGINFLSLHPYFYNSELGVVAKDTIENKPCTIEDDVWIGHGAIITPNVRRVGRGSVIAAGAVVTHDVPRYAIYAGNPAKLVRYRFPEDVIQQIEKSQWWELDKEQIRNMVLNNKLQAYSPEAYYAKK